MIEDTTQTPLIEKGSLLLTLRRLNMIVPNRLPILSLYITADGKTNTTKKALEFINSNISRIYKKVENSKLDPQVLKKDIERVEEFIEYNTGEGTTGLAAFISGYRNIFLTYPINNRFENEITLDFDVNKKPLISLLSEQPKEIYIYLTKNRSSLYRFTSNKLEEKEPPVIPLSTSESLLEYMRRVKDIYWPYFRSDDVKNVFLMGNIEAMDKFSNVLAKTVIQKLKEKVELPKKATKDRLQQTAKELYNKYRILDPKEKVNSARNLAQRRMALFGTTPVLKALREGKVKEILIDPSFSPSGWRCQRCGLLGVDRQKECPNCFSKIQKLSKLKSAINRDANSYEATITRVSHPYLKSEGGGIAAILRFS